MYWCACRLGLLFFFFDLGSGVGREPDGGEATCWGLVFLVPGFYGTSLNL